MSRTLFRNGVMLVMALALVALGLPVQPAAAQGGINWTAEIYNNPILQGSPTVTRNVPSVGFNWGTGSPDAAINPDGFSIRFATNVTLPAGTYRFYAQADDAVSVVVDFSSTVINNLNANTPGALLTGDITLGAGNHHIQVNYVENTGAASVYVSWELLTGGTPSGPGFTVAPGGSFTTGAWTAQYFSNTDLSGSPTATVNVSTPSNNWGNNSPANGVPADGFSAKFTTQQQLPGGTYQVTVRADDGVRVWINGAIVINEWHGATGATYVANFSVPGGATNIQVDFYEATGAAFLDFNLTQTGGGTVTNPQPSVPSGAATITVTARRLNVRSEPSTSGAILTVIARNETYPIVGQSADGRWFRIQVRGIEGWVIGTLVRLTNAGNVPVVGGGSGVSQPSPTGFTVSSNTGVNVRRGPGTSFAVVARLAPGTPVGVVGRTANSLWWQVNVNGVTGWVSAPFVTITPATNTASIPVTQ
jgi:uncharacterized protein YraI